MSFKQFANKNSLISLVLFFFGILIISSVLYGTYIFFFTPTITNLINQGYNSFAIKTPWFIHIVSLILAAIAAYFIPKPKRALIFFLISLFLSFVLLGFILFNVFQKTKLYNAGKNNLSPSSMLEETANIDNNLKSYWAKYENKELGFKLEYPTFISHGDKTVAVGTYEDKENNMVYIGEQGIISEFLNGRAMFIPPVSVIVRHIDNDKKLDEFIKEFGSDCKIAQKKYLYGGSDDENTGTVYEIIVDWNSKLEWRPECAMSDAHAKILYREKNGDKRVISMVISAQECSFAAPGYGKENTICYDNIILDHFGFGY